MSPKFAGASSYSRSAFGNDDDDGHSTPDSSSHMSFESNGEPVVNPKKLHTEVSSILMGFSKAKPKKVIEKDSVEFNFMGEIISEDENETSLLSIGENHIDQSRSRTILGGRYKTDTIHLADKDKNVSFDAKD